MRVKGKAMRIDGYYAMGMGILALEEDYILEVEDYILLDQLDYMELEVEDYILLEEV